MGDNFIQTREHGGPARAWNHRLTFEPTGDRSCRDTDEIECTAWLAPSVRLIFRYRHRRWRQLARVLA